MSGFLLGVCCTVIVAVGVTIYLKRKKKATTATPPSTPGSTS